ncbi:DUF1289 domain-containing protein [Endozoicomonas sp. G2_1]|uniref:DUF1289 domain-containing protein n=1 Tax=Endozoicomonas sp. G2_1 TaxID=2821091 RepID=UPI0024684A1D|nr:DUF1289 domain-containing protein [Endozoicomonas sp. G2_1]
MQLEFFDVPSPCVGICQSDDKGYCLGCMRTREERQTWLQYSSDDKQKVIKRCQQRFRRKKGLIKTKVESVETAHQQGSLFESKFEPKLEPKFEPKLEPKFEPKLEPKFEPNQAPEHPKNISNSPNKSQENNTINSAKSNTTDASNNHSDRQLTTDAASSQSVSQPSLDNNQTLDFSDFEL